MRDHGSNRRRRWITRRALLTAAGRLWVLGAAVATGTGPVAGARADPLASTYAGMVVTVVAAGRGCFQDLIPVSGVLVAKAEVEVRPERDGLMVSEVLVQPGDAVAAGSVLARLVQPAGAPPATVPVTAPVAGTVVAASAIVGSYASASAGAPMFRIVRGGELQMKGEILASVLPRLRVGQSATLDIMGLQRLDGRVTAIDPTIDALTQLGTIRIAVDADPRLRPGAFARAEVQAGERCDVALPLSSVMYGDDGAVVQVVADGRVATHRVSVGIVSPTGTVEIRDGIAEGDVVVARAGGFLRDGDRVSPLPLVDQKP